MFSSHFGIPSPFFVRSCLFSAEKPDFSECTPGTCQLPSYLVRIVHPFFCLKVLFALQQLVLVSAVLFMASLLFTTILMNLPL